MEAWLVWVSRGVAWRMFDVFRWRAVIRCGSCTALGRSSVSCRALGQASLSLAAHVSKPGSSMPGVAKASSVWGNAAGDCTLAIYR